MEEIVRRFFTSSAAGLCLALPFAAQAETGRVAGNLDGASVDFALGENASGLPPMMVEIYAGSGFTELSLQLFALQDTANGLGGVMVMLGFEDESGLEAGDFTAEMLVDGVVMVVEDWPEGSANPAQVWLAELDSADEFSVDALAMDQEPPRVAGRMASRRFCLHDFTSGDPEPLRRDGAMICKSGAIAFDAAISPGEAAPAPVEVEVLGRAEGMIGYDSYDWITIQPQGSGQATARISAGPAGGQSLQLQAHSPASSDFLRRDVLTIAVHDSDALAERTPLPGEVSFFIDYLQDFYTSSVGEGEATVTLRNLYLDGVESEVELIAEGRLCRIEGTTPVDGDCKSFEIRLQTELQHAEMD